MMRLLGWVLVALCIFLPIALLVSLSCAQEQPVVIGTTPYIAPVPETRYIYKTVYKTVKEIEVVTEIVYVPGFKEWESIKELDEWLEQDKTDEQDYIIDVHDCEDFAYFDLAFNAADDGYYIGIRAYPINEQWHMDNFAIIGNDVHKINPMNDYRTEWETLD